MSLLRTTADPPGGFGRRSYLAVGHVTVDVLPGGERRPGGSALYGALQAARLGLDATILTRGRADEIRALLGALADEVELIVEPAEATTTLQTDGAGERRRQRVLAWAGPIGTRPLPPADILHLAPVAAELDTPPDGTWPFVGLTPQGLARAWREPANEIEPQPPSQSALALFERCDAVVLSREEREACEQGIARARARGALVAVTAAEAETLLLPGSAGPLRIAVSPVADSVDDLGAGDVWAAALFVALADGTPPAEAAALAGAAASLRLRGAGPAAIATRAEIERQSSIGTSSSPVSSSGSM
jgi:sugar/nucleoside kinase (ribokinase family)